MTSPFVPRTRAPLRDGHFVLDPMIGDETARRITKRWLDARCIEWCALSHAATWTAMIGADSPAIRRRREEERISIARARFDRFCVNRATVAAGEKGTFASLFHAEREHSVLLRGRAWMKLTQRPRFVSRDGPEQMHIGATEAVSRAGEACSAPREERTNARRECHRTIEVSRTQARNRAPSAVRNTRRTQPGTRSISMSRAGDSGAVSMRKEASPSGRSKK